jgi:hypothetical protein
MKNLFGKAIVVHTFNMPQPPETFPLNEDKYGFRHESTLTHNVIWNAIGIHDAQHGTKISSMK